MSISLSIDTSDIADGELIDEADVTLPISQLQTALEDTLNGNQAFDRLFFGAAESLEIASGAITVTQSHVDVDTEGAISSDDLDTINGGVEGRILLLRNSSGRTVILKNGTGNIYTPDSTNYSLDSIQKWCFLLYGSNSKWLLLAGGGSGSSSSSGITYPDIMKAQVFS